MLCTPSNGGLSLHKLFSQDSPQCSYPLQEGAPSLPTSRSTRAFRELSESDTWLSLTDDAVQGEGYPKPAAASARFVHLFQTWAKCHCTSIGAAQIELVAHVDQILDAGDVDVVDGGKV